MVNSISICICTHNRSDLLSVLLCKLERMTVPGNIMTDVLIVDNLSTDDTRKVSSRFVEGNPGRFRYVFEDKLGLSNARNRGLLESTSEIIAFLDDDALPRDGWLEGLLEGYAEGNDVGVVGGQILLALPSFAAPLWFKKTLYCYFSEKEIHENSIVTCERITDYPYGANISFRRTLARDCGGFNSKLGRTGSQMLSGEETLLCSNIRKAGYRILINPKSIVDHYISKDRIRLKNLYEQAWNDGKCDFLLQDEKPVPLATRHMLLNMLYNPFMRAVRFIEQPITLSSTIATGYGIVCDISSSFHRWKGTDRRGR